LGFGPDEVGVAFGDSGGPAFIQDQIAGVHSFGITHFCEGVTNGTDFTCGLDSSYGEMSGDTRVSFWAPWVDAVLAGLVEPMPIPGPLAPVSNAAAAAQDVPALGTRASLLLDNVFAATMRLPVESL